MTWMIIALALNIIAIIAIIRALREIDKLSASLASRRDASLVRRSQNDIAKN